MQKNKSIFSRITSVIVIFAMCIIPSHACADEGVYTYTNKDYGFRLALPSKYQADIRIEEKGSIISLYHKDSEERGFGGQLLSIEVFTPRSAWVEQEGWYNIPVPYLKLGVSRDAMYIGLWPSDVQYDSKDPSKYQEIKKYLSDHILNNFVILNEDSIPQVSIDKNLAYIHGDTIGRINPDQGITKAEATQIIFNILDAPNKDDLIKGIFSDVSDTTWYAKPINYLGSYGYCLPDANGYFHPDSTISRAEFAILLYRIFELDQSVTWTDDPFSDFAPTHDNYFQIMAVYAMTWISGYPDGTFRPDTIITRAEAITLLNHALGRTVSKDVIPAEINPYIDLSPQHWAYADIMSASGWVSV